MDHSMAATTESHTTRTGALPLSRAVLLVYWVATLYVAVTSLGAGVIDILHAPPLYADLLRLGYPSHFATVLGVWKVLGALALVWPRYPLLKEWAYAGLFFDFTGALAAHGFAGDGMTTYVGPLLSLGALIASWFLRPPARRLARASR